MKKAVQLTLVCLALAAAAVQASVTLDPEPAQRSMLLADQNPVLPPPLPPLPPPPQSA
jgi:hypothetical protein